MASILNPYLNFRGQAREALELYRSVLGGELTTMTFAEGGMPVDPSEADHLMHGQLNAGGITLMAADTPASMELQQGSSITVSLSGTDSEELTRWFYGLAEGGTVTVPLAQAPWGDTFGMLTDRFGVSWLANIGSA